VPNEETPTVAACIECTIHGIVQGVFFRYNTKLEADRLGVAGTVRNQPDGTVRVIAEGPREDLERLLAWLHRGPDLAVVERIEATWSDAVGGRAGFRIVG